MGLKTTKHLGSTYLLLKPFWSLNHTKTMKGVDLGVLNMLKYLLNYIITHKSNQAYLHIYISYEMQRMI